MPSVTVSFEEPSYTVGEGNSVAVKVKLSANPERTVTIPITAAGQDGATSADYSVPTSVAFNSGDTEKTFSFSATQDTVDDDGESVKLGFGNLPTGVSAGSTDETTVSITDDDSPGDRLASLVVSPKDIDGFDPDTTGYVVGMTADTAEATITATPNRSDATVTINDTEVTNGSAHAVTLSVGLNTFEIVVTSPDDSADKTTYTVYIGRGTSEHGGWKAGADLDTLRAADNTEPNGIWSNGTTIWISDLAGGKLHAYSKADGARDAGKDIAVDGAMMGPTGIWSDGTTIWVIGPVEAKVFAYTLSSGARDSGNDFGLDTSILLPVDIWSDGATIWVVDSHGSKLYAYSLSDGTRDTSEDITLAGENASPRGVWSDGGTIWVADSGDSKLYAYNDSGERVAGHDIDLQSRNSDAGAIWGSDDTLWVANDVNDVNSPFNRVFAYNNVPVTVSFENTTYTVLESDDTSTVGVTENEVTVKVVLNRDPKRTVTIPITITPQGGATSADYSGVQASVTFNSGITEQALNFSATEDSVDDDGESVKFSFGTLPLGAIAGTPKETEVFITDDDDPEVTVNFERGSYAVPESDDASTTGVKENEITIKVILDGDPKRRVVIPIVKNNEDGATDSDYSGVPTGLTFESTELEKEFKFAATPDTVDDDGESVKLTFGNLPDMVTAGAKSQALVSILDDDLPGDKLSSLVVSPKDIDGFDPDVADYIVGLAANVSEATITATPNRSDATITINNTGVTGGVAHSVTLSTGLNTFEVVVTSPDDVNEQTTYTVYIGRGTASHGGWKAADDVDSLRSAGNTNPSGIWSSGATVWIADAADAMLYAYTQSNGARDAARDITLFNDNNSPAGIWSDDTTVWVADQLQRRVYAYGLSGGSRDTSREFSFSNGNNTAWGIWSDGSTMWVVDWNADKLFAYTLAGGSRDSGKDFTLVSDNSSPRGIWSDGTTIWVVDSGDDKLYAYDLSGGRVAGHDISLHSSNADAAGIWANDNTAWVVNGNTTEGSPFDRTYTYNNIAVTASFEEASYTVGEGHSVAVKVVLSADPVRTVTIPISKTNQDGATASDYSVPASVIFNSGDTEKTISFSATQDTADDDGESVKLGFGNLPSGVAAGSTDETTVSITDDDVPSVTVSFEHSSYTVAEGNSETVKVVLSADPERTVEVPISVTDMDGASSSDYSINPQTVVFNSGDTEKTFSFSATDDTEDDDGERVRLNFGALPTGVNSTSPSQAVVSITDDDVPSVTVSFEESSYTVGEGNTVAVKVVLSANPERMVTIPLTKTNQGGATASDYSVPASVVFNSGDTEKTLNFSATQDAENDDGESVKLGFGSSLPTGVTEGATDETTVSITDDDVPNVTVRFEEASYAVGEGNSVAVKVILSADPERAVTIPVTSTGQNGASSADYSVPTSVVFNSGDTEKEITFSATQDTVDDDGESVKLGFGSSLPAGVSSGSTDETTVSITDDDVPSVTVSFEQASYTVAEGNTVTVKVVLSADPERTVTIPVTATGQDGATSADFSVPNSVVFNDGDTEKTLNFSATQDTVDDDDESVKLGFGHSLPAGVTAGSTDESTVSITDDDVPSVTVSFEQTSYTVAEGNSVAIKVVLSAQPERAVDIPVSATYLHGVGSTDFLGAPTTLNFGANDTEKTINFSATDDSLDDDGEKVRLTFGNLPAQVNPGSISETTVSIDDNDHPAVTVSFASASYTVAESDDSSTTNTVENEVSVTIKLSADPERNVTIPITATGQGGATASDYSVPTSVVFDAGDTEKEITFRASPDNVDDDGESVKLGFGSTLPTRITQGTRRRPPSR